MTMEKALYKEAMNGDVSFLNEALSRDIENDGSNGYFLVQITIQHNNVIHIAVQHGDLDFLRAALRCCPSLIHQRNSHEFHFISLPRGAT